MGQTQRLLTHITLITLSLSGCSTPSEEPLEPSGSDKLPMSACTKCEDMEVFYKNGHWLGDQP
jgi:hypothetical protein